MSDEAALLRAVTEAPDDDAPRLVYADWLEERGRAERAEFIRVQCELPRLEEWDDRRPALEDREHDLLSRHERDWLGHTPPGVAVIEWGRGFASHAVCDPAGLAGAGELFGRHPISQASVDFLAPVMDSPPVQFGDAAWLAGLDRLNCFESDVDVAFLRPLLTSPHLRLTKLSPNISTDPDVFVELLSRCPSLPSLRWIELQWLPGDSQPLARTLERAQLRELEIALSAPSRALETLLRFRLAGRLESLRLNCSGINVRAEAFRSTRLTGSLRRLGLMNPQLAARVVESELGSPAFSGLTELSLWQNGSYPVRLDLLAASPFWQRATRLELPDSRNEPASLARLLSHPRPEGLRHLDMHSTRLDAAGLRAAHAAAWAGSLTELRVPLREPTDETVQLLTDGTRFRRLRVLGVGGLQDPSGRESARLAGGPSLARLREFDVFGGDLPPAAVDAILNGPHWRLSALRLSSCELTPEAVGVIARSPRLWWVGELDLTSNPRLGGDALLPLAESPHLSPLCNLSVWCVELSDRVRAALRERLGGRLRIDA